MKTVHAIVMGIALLLVPAIPIAAIIDGKAFGVISVDGYLLTCTVEYVLFMVAFSAGIVVQDVYGKSIGGENV